MVLPVSVVMPVLVAMVVPVLMVTPPIFTVAPVGAVVMRVWPVLVVRRPPVAAMVAAVVMASVR